MVQTIVPGFVSSEAVGNLGVGTKLPGFAPTFSETPNQPTSTSVMRFGGLNTPYISTHTSETPTTSASLPLDNLNIEIMQQEQKQQEVHVDEVLVLDLSSQREELMVECPQQRDEGSKIQLRTVGSRSLHMLYK